MMSKDRLTIANPGMSSWAMLTSCNGATSMTNGINKAAEKPSETTRLMRTIRSIGWVLLLNACRSNRSFSTKLNTTTLVVGSK